MPASDGYFILAVGNDEQFRRFCEFAGRAELADDARFARNADRVRNRDVLMPTLEDLTRAQPISHWLEGLEHRNVPCGPVNDLRQVFDDPQIRHRDMRITLPHPLAGSGEVALTGNPVKLSATPVTYRRAPPVLGQDTDTVLEDLLDLTGDERERLRQQQVI